MTTTKKSSKHIKSSLSTRKRIESSPKNDVSSSPISSPPTSDEELYEDYIIPHKRPLNRYDKKINDINKRAVKALQDNNKELFTEIVLETKSLYVRDDAVRIAAEVGWVDVAGKLLIMETDAPYQCPVWTAPLTLAFFQLNNDCNLGKPGGRWLLKMAVLSAVMKNRIETFNLLAPIAGVDFTNICGQDAIDHVSVSQLDSDTKKKWLSLIVNHIDRSASRSLLENAILYCGRFQLAEHLPYLLDCLFSKSKEPSPRVMATLTTAVENRCPEVVHCIVEEYKKASIPIPKIAMYAAVNIEDIDMVSYLNQNGCHEFPLRSYGERSAQQLHNFLLKHNHGSLYSSIVVESSQTA